MELFAKITGIKYKTILNKELKNYKFVDFDINKCQGSCIVNYKNSMIGLSKWVSPKRTRTYPYERVYNTLQFPKKVAIIPLVKDEGTSGDRDFLQWDTISLMSLLNIFVIPAYYIDAEINKKRPNKITNQIFDNDYIKSKISAIENYHSSALHWNLNEIYNNLSTIIGKVKQFYNKIQNQLGVNLHNIEGLEKFEEKINTDVNTFMEYSRMKAMNAQTREISTIQPKESLNSDSKTKITISNYLGGLYYFTTDELILSGSNISIIESKHSKFNKLPSLSDIKDGLLKMVLFSNLDSLEINHLNYNHKPVLKLTSGSILSSINNNSSKDDIEIFIEMNLLKSKRNLIYQLIEESTHNNFSLIIQKG